MSPVKMESIKYSLDTRERFKGSTKEATQMF